MLIGYARVSPYEQTLQLQKDALQKAGCDKIFTDTLSSAKAERKGLAKALSVLRPGDCFVVWKLDRLGTSIKELLTTMTFLAEGRIGFKSLTDTIDTTASGGNMFIRPLLHYETCPLWRFAGSFTSQDQPFTGMSNLGIRQSHISRSYSSN